MGRTLRSVAHLRKPFEDNRSTQVHLQQRNNGGLRAAAEVAALPVALAAHAHLRGVEAEL